MNQAELAVRPPKRRSVMGPRDKAVADALRRAAKPLSAYELIDLLKDEGVIAPTTMYRSLRRLMRAGLAHRLESLNAFVLCNQACSGCAAVFAICDGCGTVAEFKAPEIGERLNAWAQSTRFALGQTIIELRGRCRHCATAGAA